MQSSKLLARIGAAALAALLSVPALSQTLSVELVGSGFSSPLWATAPDGDPDRLFVVERAGRIDVLDLQTGTTLGTPFLNIAPSVSTGGERGMLGLAFHPSYFTNGKFYVSYTNSSGDSMLVQYTVLGDPLTSNVADAGSAVVIDGPVAQDFSNHNGGCIAFGADGKLYWGLGDGGSGDDPFERAQDLTSKLGKMLRYDVDLAAPYVPADNPFVGGSSADDHTWLVGLRNPWRFSFDRLTGDLYIGDVGQNSGSGREEIDFVAASSPGGLNFGWDCKNGSVCSTAGDYGCVCPSGSLVDPIHEYTTGTLGSRSITGGFVYRGGEFPALDGMYVFADYISSRVWSFRYDGITVTEFTDRTAEVSGDVGNIAGFGQDGLGEMYVLDFSDGQIFKIVEECDNPPTPYCTAVPNSTGQAANMGWNGSVSVSANDAVLVATNVPGGNSGLFFYGSDQQQVPFGNGNLCVGFSSSGFALRLPALTTDVLGFASQALDYTMPGHPAGTILPGSTWNFSFWFRDPAAGGSFFNFANGLNVTFCP